MLSIKTMIAHFFSILLFAGSVFVTSSNFVDQTSSPKYYLTTLLLSATLPWFIFQSKYVRFYFRNQHLHWIILIVGAIQAGYGMMQYFEWLPSNHSHFIIAGSFENPAGISSVLALCFPAGLFLVNVQNKRSKIIIRCLLGLIIAVVVLSESRSGILAIAISGCIFHLLSDRIPFGKSNFTKAMVAIFIVFLFVSGMLILYQLKKDSANGRLLIWQISSKMVLDKPFFGHGHQAFKAKYMDYQAHYFRLNPNSPSSPLADNTKHPFNELIKITVEYGIVGLGTLIAGLGVAIKYSFKLMKREQALVLSGLGACFVLSLFSYPLQYPPVWLLLIFYILPLILLVRSPVPPKFIVGTKVLIVAFCLCFFSIQLDRMFNEIEWNRIAKKSIEVGPKQMLPFYQYLNEKHLRFNPFFLYNYGAELNIAGDYRRSQVILSECQKYFNDYDLQILIGDNYDRMGKPDMAIKTYQYALEMIPNRFLPLLKIFEAYLKVENHDKARFYAELILSKKVKIQSYTITYIKEQASNYLKKDLKPILE